MQYALNDLIDISGLQDLLNTFFDGFGISTAIVAPNGDRLITSSRRDICSRFHLTHPSAEKQCREGRQKVFHQIKDSESPVPDPPGSNGGCHQSIEL